MKRVLAALLLLAAVGCQRVDTRLDAAGDIHAFLQAVRGGDRPTFDAHVDRAALKADLQRQFAAQGGDATSVLLGSSAGGQIVDRLIAPETFKFALDRAAPSLNRTPTTAELAAVLKVVSADQVCLPSGGLDGPCAITFARRGDVWRLVGVAASGVGVQTPYPPSAAG